MRRRFEHGFVLLLVLVALAVVGTALASLALRVHTRQQSAVLELDRLQRELALRSADAAVATQEDRLERGAAGVVSGRAVLGGQRVELRWANENAKANLNVLRERLGREVFARELGRFEEAGAAGSLGLGAGEVYDDFGLTASGAQAVWPAYVSFDQLAERDNVKRELVDSRPSIGVFDRLTLWGSGRIHTRQADPAALALALRVHLPAREADEVAQVLAGRDVADRASLREALADVIDEWDNPGRLEGLEIHLTGRPETTSLRVVVDDGRRRDVTLRLSNAASDGRGGHYELRW